MRMIILVFACILLAGPPVFAKDHYSISVSKSPQGFVMTTMTGFDDVVSCRETAVDRSKAPNDSWTPVSSDCVAHSQMSDDQIGMFKQKNLEQPYLAFLDSNDFENVVYFTNVPPVMIDAIMWKWQDELKKQGMKSVIIVMDPKRQNIMGLLAKTKASLSAGSEKNEDVMNVALAVTSEPAKPLSSTTPMITKNDSLVLKNERTVTGQILERRQDGLWFRVDEGTDLFFSYDEIKHVLTKKPEKDDNASK